MKRVIGIPTSDYYLPRRYRAVEVLAYLLAALVLAGMEVLM